MALHRLSTSASIIDPVPRLRLLMRYVDQDAKSRLRNEALRADALYEHAEILRRYLRRLFTPSGSQKKSEI